MGYLSRSLFGRLIVIRSRSHGSGQDAPPTLAVIIWSLDCTLQGTMASGIGIPSYGDLELVGYEDEVEDVDAAVAVHVRLGLVGAEALYHCLNR